MYSRILEARQGGAVGWPQDEPDPPRYVVRLLMRSKTSHLECRTDDRQEAEEYARLAVADGCLSGTVLLVNGGTVVSWWDAEELRRFEGGN